MGKIGGFVSVFTFPFLMAWHGLPAAEGAAAIVSVLGLLVTVFLLPENHGQEPGTAFRSALRHASVGTVETTRAKGPVRNT